MLVFALKSQFSSSSGLKTVSFHLFFIKNDTLCIRRNSVFSVLLEINQRKHQEMIFFLSFSSFVKIDIFMQSFLPSFCRRKIINNNDSNKLLLYKALGLFSFFVCLWVLHNTVLLVVDIGLLVNTAKFVPPTTSTSAIVRRKSL